MTQNPATGSTRHSFRFPHVVLWANRLCWTRLPWVPGRWKLYRLTLKYVDQAVFAPVAKLEGGFSIPLDLGDFVQRELFTCGVWERQTTRAVRTILNPGDVFLDVGANVGYFTLLAAQRVGAAGAVHAFEPIPRSFSTLMRNIRLNRVENVTANHLACWSENGELTIYEAPRTNSGGSSVFLRPTNGSSSAHRVKAVTLDDHVAASGLMNIDLIKIDVEGAELAVLAGAQQTLERYRPYVIVEVTPRALAERNVSVPEFLEILRSRAYRIVLLDWRGARPLRDGWGNVLGIPDGRPRIPVSLLRRPRVEAMDTLARPRATDRQRDSDRRPCDAVTLEHATAVARSSAGRPPRILYTCHAAGLGGGELRMLDHIRHSGFGPAAFRVLLFTHGELEARLPELDVPFDVLDAEHLDHRGPAWLTIGRVLARYTPDLMICNTYRDLLLAGPAAALLSIPMIWRSRADFFPSLYEKAWWRRQMFLLFLKRRVARTLCTTEYDRQLILRHGVPERNVHTLYNGVDTRLFAGAGALRRAVREEFRIGGDPVVGFIARMVPQKGHLDFLQAIASVKRQVSNVRALIVGDTTQLYGRPEYKAAVLRLVDELDLSGTVVFAGYRDDIAPIMNAIDVFASASLVEPFGTTTIEAMAAGKPVVATRTPGSMEIIDDGRTGLLVPIGDTEALADALVSIMTRPELASRLGEAALAQARQRYDLLTNIAVFDDHCRSVLEETPRKDISRRAANAAPSDRLIAESRSRVAE